MDWCELRLSDYILFRLHWAFRQSILLSLLGLLRSHRLLDNIIYFVLITLVEDGWMLQLARLQYLGMTVTVKGTLRVLNFNCCIWLHFNIVYPLLIRIILIVVLVKSDHGEFLLQRAITQLFCHHSLLLHVLVSALVVRRRLTHHAIICVWFFRLRLIPSWRVRQGHRAIYDLAIAVTVSDLVSVHKYQMGRLSRLHTLWKRLVLTLLALSPLPSTYWGTDGVFNVARLVIVTGGGAGGASSRWLCHLNVVTVWATQLW